MAKRFITPFAEAGDRAPVTDTPVGTDVNYQTGYGLEYQLDPISEPTAKFVERDKNNQILNDITANVKEWQEHVYPAFIDAASNGGVAFPYAKNSIVKLAGVDYVSTVDGNTETPPHSNWAVYKSALQASNKNELSNSHFYQPTPDPLITPVDITPRDYSAGDQVFLGWFVSTGDITGLTRDPANGNINRTLGSIYHDVPKSGPLGEYTGALVTSWGDNAGIPTEDGAVISFADMGDYYRVTLTPNGCFSAKLEQGVVASKHATEATTLSDGSKIPRRAGDRDADTPNIRDYNNDQNNDLSGWEDSPDLVSMKATSVDNTTTTERNVGNKSLKVWKKASGIRDSAVAGSFTLKGTAEPITQVTNLTDVSELADYENRDSVALFAQNVAQPADLVTSATVFTATSVTSADIGAAVGIEAGMTVEVFTPTRYVSRADSIVGNVITVEAWYEVGTVSTGTPANGNELFVNAFTKIWAHNANIEIPPGAHADSGTGFELGMLCQKAGSGSGSGGFDAVVLDGEKPDYGYRARATALTELLNGFLALANVDNAFRSQNNKVGLLVEDATESSILTKVGGSNKFRVDDTGRISGTYYPVQLASTTTTIGILTVYSVAIVAGITITLPSASGEAGKVMYVINESGGSITTNSVAVNALADGLTRKFLSDGTNWIVIVGE